MSMPSDMNADITEAVEVLEPRAGERLVDKVTPQQRGFAAAAFIAFLGVAFLGPALTRLMQPKSRVRKIEDKARFQAGALRSQARATKAKVQKKARRLGGGTIWR